MGHGGCQLSLQVTGIVGTELVDSREIEKKTAERVIFPNPCF